MPGKKNLRPFVSPSAFKLSSLILFLLSLLYLGVELFFNVMLLDVSSSVRSDPGQVEQVQYFGRIASGFGFTLLVLGIFQRFGFRISGRRGWLVFSAVAFVCLLPFVLTFAQILFGIFNASGGSEDLSYMGELFWGLLPFIGLALVLASRGGKPFVVVLGLIVLAWPAMFYGQKLAIERFIIARTTAGDRLNANYILLMKTGIEDCLVALEGVPLCDGSGGNAEKSSTRAVLGALFMLNPAEVFKSLSAEQGRIIAGMASRGLWFSPKEYYKAYLERVAAERGKYAQLMHERYYLPYKKASDLYLDSADPPSLKKIADDAAALVENGMAAGERRRQAAVLGIESARAGGEKQYQQAILQADKGIAEGWRQYQKAVADYHRAIRDMIEEDLQKIEPLKTAYGNSCQGDDCLQELRQKYDAACRSGNCGGVDIDAVIRRARQLAEQNFYEASGYPTDLRDEAAWLKHPATQKKLREAIEKDIQDITADRGFQLPEGWRYDPPAFKLYLQQLIQKKLHEGIEKNARDMMKDESFRLPAGWRYDRPSFDATFRPLMQKILQGGIEGNIRDMTGDANFALPEGWKYDPETFRAYIQKLVQQKAQEAWKNKVQAQFKTDLPPGLGQEEFFRSLGIEPLPPLEKLAMPESEFMQRYIVPMNEKASREALEKIRSEAPLYANGEKLSKRGKDYVRVLYIPAIALCLSLLIVVLTVGRNLVNAACWIVEKRGIAKSRQNAVRPLCRAVFLALVLVLPYLWPNPYTESAAYRKYYRLARQGSLPPALLLDWTVHMQPVIYRAGKHIF